MSNNYNFEDRRQSPYSNTNAWDTKTWLAFCTFSVMVVGGIFASWLSLNTELTKIHVTQDLKFQVVDQHILADAQRELRINAQIESVESTVHELYSRYQSQQREQSLRGKQ